MSIGKEARRLFAHIAVDHPEADIDLGHRQVELVTVWPGRIPALGTDLGLQVACCPYLSEDRLPIVDYCRQDTGVTVVC